MSTSNLPAIASASPRATKLGSSEHKESLPLIEIPPLSPHVGAPSSSASPSKQSQAEFSRFNVTDEDKLLAMLGYKDLNRSEGPDGKIYYREEFCGACGIIHSNPDVLDTYYTCMACHCVIREPSLLRQRYRNVKPETVLEILSASYGEPNNPGSAYDVTAQCQRKLHEFQERDRIVFRPKERMDLFFGHDPAPGRNKQVRLRYRIHGAHGTMVLDFNPENKIPSPFLLMAPKKQYLRLFSASYGHPKGLTKTGRMSYDVREVLQSLVDQNGGSFLSISAFTPLSRLLGDPCPGYTKDLRVEFEIVGRSGELRYSELRGHLTKRLLLQSSPCVSPILFVQAAFYGITPTARKDRLDFIHKQLKKIDQIDHRRGQGLPVQPEEMQMLRMRGPLLRQKEVFLHAQTKFIDVSEKMQRLADKGQYQLVLDKDSFDPNEVFGNPNPGQPKILEVLIDCQGHDSERLTETVEMMDTGYPRNFITVKKNRFNIAVDDRPVYEDEVAAMEAAKLAAQAFAANRNRRGGQVRMTASSLSSLASFVVPGSNNSKSNKNAFSSLFMTGSMIQEARAAQSEITTESLLAMPNTQQQLGKAKQGSQLPTNTEQRPSSASNPIVTNHRPFQNTDTNAATATLNNPEASSRQQQLEVLRALRDEYREMNEEQERKAAGRPETPVAPRKIAYYKGLMQESLVFQTDYVSPLIVVKRATYGELGDLNKCIDVTREVQYQVRGRALDINTDVDLHKLFHKDPSPGRRKQLEVSYIMRGFMGNLRVREKNDCLVAGIQLGYPPVPPPDDENIITKDG